MKKENIKKQKNSDKPIVVLYKSDRNSLVKKWKFFRRYKTRPQALNDIASQLGKSDLFKFKIKGEKKFYYRGY